MKLKAREIGNRRAKPLVDCTLILAISLSTDADRLTRLLPMLLSWIDHHTRRHAIIIGDHLQKHNELVLDARRPSDADKITADKADRIRGAVSRFDPCPVIMTSDLIADALFGAELARYEEAYVEREEFRAFVDQGAGMYLERRQIRAVPGDDVWRHCVAYQLEELAIYEILVGRGYDALAYAGPQLPVMKALVEERLPPLASGLKSLRLVELRSFEKAKSA